MLNIEFVKLEQTCFACPSQWDAWDKDNNYYYIRFRHGALSVELGNHKDRNYKVLLERDDCNGDGFMTTEEMLNYTGCTLAENCICNNQSDDL